MSSDVALSPRQGIEPLPVPTGRDLIWAMAAIGLLPIAVVVAGALLAKWSGRTSSGLFIVLLLLALAAMVVGGVWAVRRAGWTWRDAGFVRPARSLWHLLWETPVLVIASIAGAVLASRMFKLAPQPAATRDSSLGLVSDQPVLLVLVALGMVVVGPVLEEVLFRRFLLDWLRSRMPAAPAILLTAALFGAMHVMPAAIAYVFWLGLGLTLLRVWHGTLWGSVLPHITNNALVSVIVLASLSR